MSHHADDANAASRQSQRLVLDLGGMQRDALARGISATLALFEYTEDSRFCVLASYRLGRTFAELICSSTCRALWGHDEPGVYDVRIDLSPESIQRLWWQEEPVPHRPPGSSGESDCRVLTSRLNTAELELDAAKRRLTGHLLIAPRTEDSRAFVVIGHRAGTLLGDMLHVEGCRAFFGVHEPGIYDMAITRALSGPGGE